MGNRGILGAGPLAFELVEPFRHWKMRFDGLAMPSTVADQIANRPARTKPSPVLIDIDIRSVVPPWENGGLLPEARRVLDEQDEGALMGGPRFEQLSRATGTVRVGGSARPFDGGALRVRRQGVRRLGTFRGHAWQSAVFPSGRAFGYITYPPREDGLATYNEGYLSKETAHSSRPGSSRLRGSGGSGPPGGCLRRARDRKGHHADCGTVAHVQFQGDGRRGVEPGLPRPAAGHRFLHVGRRVGPRHDGTFRAGKSGHPSVSVGAANRVNDVIAKARAETGFEDFGGDGWREGSRSWSVPP